MDRRFTDIDNVDLDLIATSYRALVEPAAFDDMIEAWNRKLSLIDEHDGGQEEGIAGKLLAHLERLQHLAEADLPLVEDPIRQVVEASAVATMVQSPEGQVIALNKGAEALFGAVAGVNDTLDWLAPGSHAEFFHLRRSASGAGNRQRAILRLVDTTAQHDEGEDESSLLLAEAELLRLPSADKAFVVVRPLGLPWLPAVEEALTESFSLTPAEIDVVRLFYALRDLDGVAAQRKVSIQTVRTQFKAILGKTETRTQANLLHLAAMLCARAAVMGGGQDAGWVTPFGNEQILPRSGGARLAYSWAGASAGQPVLWLHGPAFNGVPPHCAIEAFSAAGMRLIFPSRPGYGNSDRDHSLSVEEDQVSAIVELAEALNLRECMAVGTTCSTQALHLARDRAPERIGTIIGISFCWKASTEEVQRLPVVHRTLFKLARRAPAVLRTITTVALRIIRRQGPDWYVQRAHGYSDVNRKCLRDPENQALLRADCNMMLAQGPEGFISDLLLAYVDTNAALDRARARTIWLMGGEDQHYCPRDTVRQAADLPGVDLHVLDGCSELMLYQQPLRVADIIVSAGESASPPPESND